MASLWSRVNGSIRYKMALLMLAAVCCALLVAGAALSLYEMGDYREQAMRDLGTQAEILGRASASALAFDDAQAVKENLQLLRSHAGLQAAAIYGARGKRVAEYRSAEAARLAIPDLPEADGIQIAGEQVIVFKRVVENGEIVGTVYLNGRYELRERLRDFLGILLGVMVASLFVTGLLSLWLQRAFTRPILAVSAAARRVVAARDFSLRVPQTTRDEVGLLVESFNGMLAELGQREQELAASQRRLEQEAEERRRVDDDLRQLNAELEQHVAQRTAQLESANKELEGFSYSVSHDLRTPLRGVVGFSDALLEDHGAELSEEAQRKLRIVHGEGLRMGRLIDDLLAFSRLGRKALQTTKVDMESLARNGWKSVTGAEPDARLRFDLGRLPQAQGDPALLTQVWINLLSNAVKFSAKRDAPQVTVSAITDGEEHVYFVRDNGAGFNPKYQDKLFGVFQRLHDSESYAGTGVGLALVQRIVVRHGGRVWAEGQPDQGATFYFTLPKEPRHESL
ncbi:HAMP domain-containing histidine kinase [Pelomonas sp. KK5]|uniref:HAMP domain-containing histidine kinase n=1 Tax=Pelomonas sp. KK5 TaxID=1855730 RepID=UPI00097BFFD3|nr:HAMP domain-containing histidine kinase [Pelomonas sp. KK5]